MLNTQHTLFVSYRQVDSTDFVERIRDWLITKYGRDHVFMDFDSIPRFANFRNVIRERLEKSDAVLVIIGERWLELLQEKERNGEPDYVLFELETALSANKILAPVLIKGGRMPRYADLPKNLHGLLEFNAAKLESGANFYSQIQALMNDLEVALHNKTTSPPPTKESYLDSGVEKYNLSDYDGAIADYTEALRIDPAYAFAYNNRGLSRQAKNDLEGAIADYTQALRLTPNDADIYFNRGISHQYKGNLDSAITDYTEAIRLEPGYVTAYINRGIASKDKGDHDGAIADYTQAIRLDPNDALAYKNRAVSYRLQHNYAQAIANYQRYLDLGGGTQNGDQSAVENLIAHLKKEL